MEQRKLNEEEWAVVIDLLECESRQLPTEIHHASLADVKQRLRRRREVVTALLERLSPVEATDD